VLTKSGEESSLPEGGRNGALPYLYWGKAKEPKFFPFPRDIGEPKLCDGRGKWVYLARFSKRRKKEGEVDAFSMKGGKGEEKEKPISPLLPQVGREEEGGTGDPSKRKGREEGFSRYLEQGKRGGRGKNAADLQPGKKE